MSENQDDQQQSDGKIVNPPNPNQPSGENTDGEIVNPGMAADLDDGVGDAGDQANDVRFAQEQSLIGEQSQGVFPDEEKSEQVPDEEPQMDEAMGDVDEGDSSADDASDDPAHLGGPTA
ncbi:MAG TPA: hypothetical protein VFM62_04230 [Arthrobacter sp.]|nr:hypothetical protein [Arthrobacter sp.]